MGLMADSNNRSSNMAVLSQGHETDRRRTVALPSVPVMTHRGHHDATTGLIAAR